MLQLRGQALVLLKESSWAEMLSSVGTTASLKVV